jgi:hypothetical protein
MDYSRSINGKSSEMVKPITTVGDLLTKAYLYLTIFPRSVCVSKGAVETVAVFVAH